MWRKIFESSSVGEYDLKERMLRVVIQMGGVAVILGMLEGVIISGESKIMMAIMAVVLLIITVSFFSSSSSK